MTWRGAAALLILIGVLALALSTGGRTVYFILLFLAVFVLFCLVSVLISLFSAKCRPELTDACVMRGNAQQLTVRIGGFRLLPVMARFRVDMPEGLCRLSAPVFSLVLQPGKKPREVTIDLPCAHRGKWHIGIGPVSVVDLFGLFSFRLSSKAFGPDRFDVTVYPRVYDMDAADEALSLQSDSFRPDDRMVDSGDSYAGIREYLPGDSMRRVHWVQTARTRQIQTRQYDANTEQYGLLLVDMSVNREQQRYDYADYASEVAAMMSQYYLSAGLSMRMHTVGRVEEDIYANDMSGYDDIYDFLTGVEFGCEDGPCPTPPSLIDEATSLRIMTVVTARPDVSLKNIVEKLQARRCRVTCFVTDTPEGRGFEAACQGRDVRIIVTDDIGAYLQAQGGMPV